MDVMDDPLLDTANLGHQRQWSEGKTVIVVFIPYSVGFRMGFVLSL